MLSDRSRVMRLLIVPGSGTTLAPAGAEMPGHHPSRAPSVTAAGPWVHHPEVRSYCVLGVPSAVPSMFLDCESGKAQGRRHSEGQSLGSRQSRRGPRTAVSCAGHRSAATAGTQAGRAGWTYQVQVLEPREHLVGAQPAPGQPACTRHTARSDLSRAQCAWWCVLRSELGGLGTRLAESSGHQCAHHKNCWTPVKGSGGRGTPPSGST